MARIDKAHVVVRGVAGTTFAADGKAKGVRVNTGGSVVLGGGTAGTCDGVLVTNANRAAYGTITAVADRVDILTRGEIVEFGGTAGDRIRVDANGNLVAGGTVGTVDYVGYVMDGGNRLVVQK